MKKISTFILALALMTTFGVGAFAVSENAQTAREKVALKKAELQVKQCESVQEKVENKYQKNQEYAEKRLDSFNKTKLKLEKFIERLEDKGYDVEVLKADLVTFDSKVEKYKADYAVYNSSIKETGTFACSKNEGEFKAKLASAREQLKIVQQSAVEVRTFYAKTFRVHILEIKGQIPKNEDTEVKETEEQDTDTTAGTSQEATTTDQAEGTNE